jgi:hypothetical protein
MRWGSPARPAFHSPLAQAIIRNEDIMSRFGNRIRPRVSDEIGQALEAERRGDAGSAFVHLQRAHVLGQASTREHVRAHWHMLRWSIRHRRRGEFLGQLLRIAGAAGKTAFGLVPAGNTGGSDISPFRRLPVPADLATIIEDCRNAPPPDRA